MLQDWKLYRTTTEVAGGVGSSSAVAAAPGESVPYASVTYGAGAGTPAGYFRPFEQKITGKSTKGFNEGIAEVWYNVEDGGGLPAIMVHRDAWPNLSNGYYLYIQNTRLDVKKGTLGGGTTLGSATGLSGLLTVNVWHGYRLKWYKSSNGTQMNFEMYYNANDGNGYVKKGSTIVDSSPLADNADCEAYLGIDATNSTSVTNRWDGFRLYNVIPV